MNNEPISVPTSNGPDVLLDREDAEAIKASGSRLFWNIAVHGSYVYTNRGPTTCGKQIDTAPFKPRRADRSREPQCGPVSRRLMQPAPGQRIRYKNGNHADLRRENLLVSGSPTVAPQQVAAAP